MTAPSVTVHLAALEARHLADLVGQFAELLDDDQATTDPAVARLVPDAYADASAAREFRRLTEVDLLGRRRSDAETVLRALAADDPSAARGAVAGDPASTIELVLSAPEAAAWLRTLAALRLVLATRLGIRTEDDHDPEDPRFGVYDWLGYRLELLVRAREA